MAKEITIALTQRDFQILQSLDRVPMTSKQLQVASRAYEQPFGNESLVRRRLSKLKNAELVKPFRYSLVSLGRAPNYWKLTPKGYRAVYGDDASHPNRRYFAPVSLGSHFHTNAIASLISHLSAMAAENGHTIDRFCRENSLAIGNAKNRVYPDSAFRIRASDGRSFPFVLELDNGTERVRTKRDVESIERKILAYDADQQKFKRDDPNRYLLLFVTTRSVQRLRHILDACNSLISNPQRTLMLGATLDALLDCDPFHTPIFESNNGLRRTLLPRSVS